MKHKPIFRLALLALLLAGCGKDTTELPEGPETPATGGDAIVCRLSIGNEAPDPTDETRTAYGPAYRTVITRSIGACRPRGNHLSADDPAMGGGRSQRLRGDRNAKPT